MAMAPSMLAWTCGKQSACRGCWADIRDSRGQLRLDTFLQHKLPVHCRYGHPGTSRRHSSHGTRPQLQLDQGQTASVAAIAVTR